MQQTADATSVLVVGTPRRAGFADTMLRDIDRAFRLNGVESHLVLMEGDDDLSGVVGKANELAAAGRQVLQFDLNATFTLPPSVEMPPHRRFTLLLDHPFFHMERVLACTGDVTIGVVDRTHMPALADYGVDLPVRFVPHAGPDPDPAPRPMGERDIDVLYCANLTPLIFEPVFNKELGQLSPSARDLTVETVNRVMAGQGNIHAALREACRDVSGGPLSAFPAEELKRVLFLVEGLAVSLQRRDLVEALCRIPDRAVHIVGNIPDVLNLEALAPLPNVRVHGMLPFEQVVEMMGRARILVNANFSITGGAHERIWQAMATGCVLLTNESGYMRDSFVEEEEILFMPGDMADLPSMVEERLRSPEQLDAMAARASAVYAREHLWKHRVAPILSC